MAEEKLKAIVKRVTYRNSENSWTVLKVDAKGYPDLITATGHFPDIHAGESFEFQGEWTSHPKFGKQFKIEKYVAVRPTDKKAIEKYLSSGVISGIGPKTAARIVKHFGEDTLDILDQSPERLMEVPSIGKKKVGSMIESWKDQKAIADVMVFLGQHGVSPLFATRIFKAYGHDAQTVVTNDPYRLASEIQGIGFISADRIAQSLGVAPDSLERIRAATLYSLQQAEEKGHCFVTTPQLLSMLIATLGLTEDVILGHLGNAIQELNERGTVVSEPYVDQEEGKTSAHYRTDLLMAEWSCVNGIGELLQNPFKADKDRIATWLTRYSEAATHPLSDEQAKAVMKAASEKVFILTGGPGVGKTTTANAIIRILKAMGKNVALAAPTGRAAQRLSEVAALPAKTIHRMLEWQPHQHGFARDETNPLTVQAVIIDEASMLDVRLADALIRAVPRTAQLIFIGDVDQLPSVGPGNVLRDLIESGSVPFTRLSQVFRQAATSKIIATAHAINTGNLPKLTTDEGSDCLFIDCDSGEELKDKITELVSETLPNKNGFDPLEDIQILTPMNRGDLGTSNLNQMLQSLLNPKRPGIEDFQKGSLLLRNGDKVIQSSNNYDLGVFNGDIGFVVDTKIDGGKLVINFGDRNVVYDSDQALDLRLAYAITIHKSQGSEFPAVIIPATMQHYIMLQRNLMYTALTRAKKLAIFVGSAKALKYAVSNQTSQIRQTQLMQKLNQKLIGQVSYEPL